MLALEVGEEDPCEDPAKSDPLEAVWVPEPVVNEWLDEDLTSDVPAQEPRGDPDAEPWDDDAESSLEHRLVEVPETPEASSSPASNYQLSNFKSLCTILLLWTYATAKSIW